VTLADSGVRKALKKDFVCSWFDATGDPEMGRSFAHDPKEKGRKLERGSGEHNLQVLFLTPKGEIFHAVAGYSTPKDFLAEIALARKIYAAITAGGDPAATLTSLQEIAAADARREVHGWNAAHHPAVLAREFVASHPLFPASQYRPSLIFGPGGGVFFGVGRPKHGFLGDTEEKAEDPSAAFIRESEQEWELVSRSP
jgi:hypothetical protein